MAGQPQRLHYIDWLRLMAVFLLFTYHAACIFHPWGDFYIQNEPRSPLLAYIFVWAVGPWHMSLFFLLAGASTYYALQRRSGGQYVRERFKRLFIPFAFGVLVLIPPQSYLGLLNHSSYSGSFITWFPNFFTLHVDDLDGFFRGGHTWGHLWFIFHLFVYSLAAVSLFLYLNRESGQRVIGRLAGAFARPGFILLFPVLLALFAEVPQVAGGNPLFYITFFICGFLLMSDPRFMNTVDRQRVALLILGPVVYAGILFADTMDWWPSHMPEWTDTVIRGYVRGFVPWFVILAMLAYGRRFLNFTNRFLKYFAEAAYPMYILHDTIIVIVGFYIVQLGVGVPAKYATIVVASFAATVIVYDLVVKRANVTRFLFGMKPRGPTTVRSRITSALRP